MALTSDEERQFNELVAFATTQARKETWKLFLLASLAFAMGFVVLVAALNVPLWVSSAGHLSTLTGTLMGAQGLQDRSVEVGVPGHEGKRRPWPDDFAHGARTTVWLLLRW